MEKPIIPESDEALLAECDVETFRSGGKGGQNVNRRETAVRLRHRPTGVEATCQQERTQWRNKQIALENLREKIRSKYRKRKKRVPTRKPKAVKEEILQKKKETAQKKKLRKPPKWEE